jgi:hypothetical protein
MTLHERLLINILTGLAPPPPAVEAFFQKFTQIYESHGGLIAAHPQHGKKPWMGPGNLADGGEVSVRFPIGPHLC